MDLDVVIALKDLFVPKGYFFVIRHIVKKVVNFGTVRMLFLRYRFDIFDWLLSFAELLYVFLNFRHFQNFIDGGSQTSLLLKK